MLSYYYAKVKENPWVGTDVSTGLQFEYIFHHITVKKAFVLKMVTSLAVPYKRRLLITIANSLNQDRPNKMLGLIWIQTV